jgi:glycosyltransferase involved in cell wall biosynthesis
VNDTTNCIIINALSARGGGADTYLVNLLNYVERYENLRVIVVASQNIAKKLENKRIEIFSVPDSDNTIKRLYWELFEQKRFAESNQADLIYFPGGTITMLLTGKFKTAVAFRNMLPFSSLERSRYPLGGTRFKLWLLHYLQLFSFNRADLVIFISKYAKSVIDDLAKNRRGISKTIYHGISDHFRTSQVKSRPSNLPFDYVLYVSRISPYKAHLEVIEAWGLAKQKGTIKEKLVLIGERTEPYGQMVQDKILELGLKDDVIQLGNVNYNDLPSYYQNAKLNLFASSCENCPNILLEALASGRPVLSSNYPPMPEFAENAALYFDPYQPTELADLIVKTLGDADAQHNLIANGKIRSQEFNWDFTASQTWDALIDLCKNPLHP